MKRQDIESSHDTEMSFEEIANRLGMTNKEVRQLYVSAIKKLKRPSVINRVFWDYVKLSGDGLMLGSDTKKTKSKFSGRRKNDRSSR